MLLTSLLILAPLQAHADDPYLIEAQLLPRITSLEIERATSWLRVAALDGSSLGDVLIDCYGTVNCRVNTTRLGDLRVVGAEFVSTRAGEGVEIEVIANGGSHWIWIEPNPSP